MSAGPGTPANAQFGAELKLPPAELFHRIFMSPLLRSSDRVSQHRIAVPRALPTPPAPPSAASVPNETASSVTKAPEPANRLSPRPAAALAAGTAGLPETGM